MNTITRMIMAVLFAGLMALPVMAQNRERPQQPEGPRRGGVERQRDGARPQRGGEDRQRGGGRGGRGDMQRGMARFAEELGLSEDQQTEMKEIFTDFRTDREEFMKENKEDFDKIRSSMREAREDQDWDKMRELGGEMRELMQDGPNFRDLMEEANQVLTEEQRKKAQEMMASRMRGRGGEGRPGERDGQQAGGDRDRGGVSSFGGRDRDMRVESRLQRLLAQLDLTEKQKVQIKAIMQKHTKLTQAFNKKNGTKVREIQTKLRQAYRERDTKKIEAIQKQMEALRKGSPNQETLVKEIMTVLNKKQQEKLKALLKQSERRGRPDQQNRQSADRRGGERNADRPRGQQPGGEDAKRRERPTRGGEGERPRRPRPEPEPVLDL